MDEKTSNWRRLSYLMKERRVVPESTFEYYGFKNKDIKNFTEKLDIKRTVKILPYKYFKDSIPIETAHLYPGRISYRGSGDLFYLSDSLLNYHSLAPEVFFEFKFELKHLENRMIPKLLKEIIFRYNKIRRSGYSENVNRLSIKKSLAASFFLTFRNQYMYPVDIRKYLKVMGPGTMKKLVDISKIIGESGVRYSGDEIVKNSFEKLKKNLGLSDSCEDIFYKLYKIDARIKRKDKVLSSSYAGGLAYLAAVLAGENAIQEDIAGILGISVNALGNNSRSAFDRLEIKMEI